jgi:hypothetical protein
MARSIQIWVRSQSQQPYRVSISDATVRITHQTSYSLAVAQTSELNPCSGLSKLRRNGVGNGLTARTFICPGSCSHSTELFYLGYWERIKPSVATSSGPRSVGSAASIDRLIRLEIAAHPMRSVPQSTFANLPARVHAGRRMAAIACYRESAGSKSGQCGRRVERLTAGGQDDANPPAAST